MPTITCKVSVKLDAKLTALAREQRRSKSALLREALEERLATNRRKGEIKAIDLVGRLSGCLKGGPSDLSHNPAHLRGFGE